MNDPQIHPNSSHQHGFILITSLLFLVIITLLALSGIGSSTLQQKMATNSNDKAQSLQAANSTLAYAQSLIDHMSQPPIKKNTCYTFTNTTDVKRTKCNGKLRIIKYSKRIRASKWLATQTWKTWKNSKVKKVQSYQPPHDSKTTYRVTFIHHKGCGLGQNCQATATSGYYNFTITARSKGTNDKAPTVTQSVYRKRY